MWIGNGCFNINDVGGNEVFEIVEVFWKENGHVNLNKHDGVINPVGHCLAFLPEYGHLNLKEILAKILIVYKLAESFLQ